MPIKTSEDKFEFEPYGMGQMIVIFSIITIISLISVIIGIIFRQIQESWILYPLAGVAFLIGCVLFGVRYRKLRAGSLEKITIDIEGIRVHSRKAGTIKFMSWEDIKDYTIGMVDIGDEIQISCPSSILVVGENDEIDIDLEDYATLFVKADKIIEEFGQAFKLFKKKYRKKN
ncbi:MAG: hypothetical protein HGN29_17305 [Asgard group archaeon]|nr:hypothetical protein [Asgard group archaeon]